MRVVSRTNKFKKEYKLSASRGKDMTGIDTVIAYLVNEIPLPPDYHEHSLHGKYKGKLECHIENNWLMIYEIDDTDDAKHKLVLVSTGTHSDLFK